MTPIGRGQRELIIGDRKTGKTAVAIDTILNQKGGDVICVYVACGQRDGDRRRHRRGPAKQRRDGLHDRRRAIGGGSRLRCNTSLPMPGRRSPSTSCIRASTRCASTTTCRSRLRRIASCRCSCGVRPVARPIPATCSTAHSRLLERAVKLNDELGGGSMTALPIIETLEGEVSAYIPTNVISITDGQIYLEPDLFFAGVRPAINVGISVSRVGGNAQTKAMKKVAGSSAARPGRLPRTGSVRPVGHRTRHGHAAQLDRGYRMVELLKQPQYPPLHVRRSGDQHLRRHERILRQSPGDRGARGGTRVAAVHARAKIGSPRQNRRNQAPWTARLKKPSSPRSRNSKSSIRPASLASPAAVTA